MRIYKCSHPRQIRPNLGYTSTHNYSKAIETIKVFRQTIPPLPFSLVLRRHVDSDSRSTENRSLGATIFPKWQPVRSFEFFEASQLLSSSCVEGKNRQIFGPSECLQIPIFMVILLFRTEAQVHLVIKFRGNKRPAPVQQMQVFLTQWEKGSVVHKESTFLLFSASLS